MEKERLCYNIAFCLKGKVVCEYASVFGTDIADALEHLGEHRRELGEPRIEYDEIRASFCQMTMTSGRNKDLGWYTHRI